MPKVQFYWNSSHNSPVSWNQRLPSARRNLPVSWNQRLPSAQGLLVHYLGSSPLGDATLKAFSALSWFLTIRNCNDQMGTLNWWCKIKSQKEKSCPISYSHNQKLVHKDAQNRTSNEVWQEIFKGSRSQISGGDSQSNHNRLLWVTKFQIKLICAAQVSVGFLSRLVLLVHMGIALVLK